MVARLVIVVEVDRVLDEHHVRLVDHMPVKTVLHVRGPARRDSAAVVLVPRAGEGRVDPLVDLPVEERLAPTGRERRAW